MAKLHSGATQGNRDLERILLAIRTDLTSLTTLVNGIKTVFNGKGLLSKSGMAIGSTKPNVANGALSYMIAGVEYAKAATAEGTALSGDNVPQAKYGAWALDIDVAGTITIAPAAANAAGYASAVLAIAGLPAVAAAKVRLGWVTAINTGGVFDPGTTDLNAGTVTDTYTDATSLYNDIGAAVTMTLE